MLLDDAIASRQSKSRAVNFCREEWRENMRQIFFANAAALIREVDPDETIRPRVLSANMIVGFHPRRDRQRAAAFHRLKGVFYQVEKNLSELCPVATDRRQTRIKAFSDLNIPVADRLAFQQQDILQDLVDVDGRERELRRARKVSLVHLLDQLGLALALERRPVPSAEEKLFADLTRPYSLGRYSDCLDLYSAELAAGADGALSLDELIVLLGGHALMERLRQERPVNERYPDSVERLRVLIEASSGETLEAHMDDMLCRVALSSSAEAETDPNRVNLLTLHSTKGLEFSRVYVVGVENQILPGWRAIQEDRTAEIQEARRLLYVGMTRAKDRLVLTHTEQRAGYPSLGSLFLAEAGLTLDPGIPSAKEAPVVYR